LQILFATVYLALKRLKDVQRLVQVNPARFHIQDIFSEKKICEKEHDAPSGGKETTLLVKDQET
jgi:hypothetical protein